MLASRREPVTTPSMRAFRTWSPGDSGHVDDGRRAARLRHRLVVFAQALDVKADRRADLVERLLPGSTGRNAPGQVGNVGPSASRKVVVQLAGDGHGSGLVGMPVMPMASSGANQRPAGLLDQADRVTDLRHESGHGSVRLAGRTPPLSGKRRSKRRVATGPSTPSHSIRLARMPAVATQGGIPAVSRSTAA